MPRLSAELRSAVAAARRARGLTQRELAGLAGVSRQTVVELEKGSYNPSTALALRIAVLLDVQVEALFQLPEAEVQELRRQRERLDRQREEADRGYPASLAAVQAGDRARA